MKKEASNLNNNLPDDLLPGILSTLSVKSLVRFRGVSKSWQGLIDDPEFRRSHLNSFSENRNEIRLVCIQSNKHGAQNCVIRCNKTLEVTPNLGFSLYAPEISKNDTFGFGNNPALSHDTMWNVISSIDGVYAIRGLNWSNGFNFRPIYHLMLWNPSIRKARILPPSSKISGDMEVFDFGLVFDPSVKDYKLVRFVASIRSNLHSLEIYTLGTNSWKTIEFRGIQLNYYHISCRHLGNTIFFKGFLYLIPSDSMYSDLVSFEMSTGVFASTKLPTDIDLISYSQTITLVDGGSTIALLYFGTNSHYLPNLVTTGGSLWVLEKFGADIQHSIWTKRYTFSSRIRELSDLSVHLMLYLKKNGDLKLFFNWKNVVTSCSIEALDQETLVSNKLSLGFMNIIGTYIESLILL